MLKTLIQRSDRLAEIAQRLGFALWQLQELEGATAQYFVLRARASRGMGIREGATLINKAQSKTFGATVCELKKTGLLSANLEKRFEDLLKERNWLVHASRATSRNAVNNDASMHRLLVRVDSIADEATTLLKELEILAVQYVTEHGVSMQDIAAETDRLLDHWHAEI